MFDVTAMYGPYGPDSVGDAHVADLLKRTVEAQPPATQAWAVRISSLLATGCLVSQDRSITTATHAEWLAATLWQMASCYLDATAVCYADQADSFATTAYRDNDKLCDSAAHWARQAVQTRALIESGSKTSLTQVATLPTFTLNPHTLQGAWDAYGFVAARVASDSQLFTTARIPTRLRQLYREVLKQIDVHLKVVRELQKDFRATTIMQNRKECLDVAMSHFAALFLLGQQLWAPYLLGSSYAEAMRQPLTLEELELPFDPWTLTDPVHRATNQTPARLTELAQFWSSVVDYQAVKQIAEQLADLRKKRAIRPRTAYRYASAPWPIQYLVRRPVTLSGRSFTPGDLIVIYAHKEGQQVTLEIRKTGRLTGLYDLLGQPHGE